MTKQKAAVLKMIELRERYEAERVSEDVSVHRTLIRRALPLIYEYESGATEFFEPMKESLADIVTSPDREGDYEKGMGRHYYCAVNFLGMRLYPVAGYYKNGIGRFSKSARTMLEEDYTMALTMHKAGFGEASVNHLARAVHMISDMSCLPHATQMTYFSPKRHVHKAYESLARAMYPDALPEQKITEACLHIFDCRSSFTVAVNNIAEEQIDEPKQLFESPDELIRSRLYAAERAVAALLYRFYKDCAMEPDECNCLRSGEVLLPKGKLPPFLVNVTAEGITLTPTVKDEFSRFMASKTFRVAHRRDGLFTLSPVDNEDGLCAASGKVRLMPFSPEKRELLFKAKML